MAKDKQIEQQRLQQLEQDRLRQQAEEQQRLEKQRIEHQKLEQQRLQQQQLEQQRVEQQRVEQQRVEQQRVEQQRVEQQRIQQQLEQQRIEQQKLEHQQQQRAEQMRNEQKRLEQQQRHEETRQLRRSQTPSLTRRATFEPINQGSNFKKAESHFGQVRTGHVNEKRNFWMRSVSTDKLHQHEMSPGPRRRRITGQDWIKQDTNQSSRPGSSLGHVIGDSSNQTVKSVVSGWSDLSKSKSSAAVLQERGSRAKSRERKDSWRLDQPQSDDQNKSSMLSEAQTNQVQGTVNKWGHGQSEPASASGRNTPIAALQERGPRARSRERKDSWRIEQSQLDDQRKSSMLSEAHTNQVQETVTKWGHGSEPTSGSGRNTPVLPTRNIGDTFAEGRTKVVKPETTPMPPTSSTASSGSSPWRTKNPAEPTLKVLNVAVENNVHISDNAASQMASFVQQESKSVASSSHQSMTTSSSTLTSTSTKSMQQNNISSSEKHVSAQVPPKSPGPSRKMPPGSPKGKSVTASSKSDSRPSLEQSKPEPVISNSSCPISMSVVSQSNSTTMSSSSMNNTNTSWSMKEEFKSEQKSLSSSETTSVLHHHQQQSSQQKAVQQEYSVLNEWLAGEEKQLQESIRSLENSSPTKRSTSGANISAPLNVTEVPIQMINEDSNEPEMNLKGKVKDGINIFQAEPKPQKHDLPVFEDLEGSHGKAKQALYQQQAEKERFEQEKIERVKELDEIKHAAKVHQRQRQVRNKSECEDDGSSFKPSSEVLEVRSKVLQEVASRREITPTSSDEDGYTNQERAAEKAKQERNKELAEIAEMRTRTNWQDVVVASATDVQSRATPTRTPDPDLEEARTTIRHAAARWQAREQKEQPRYGTPPSGRNTPSRRIGKLFDRNSEHWNMESADDDFEEFPAPPTDIEMVGDPVGMPLPAPPPRDSSRDVMQEYANNGTSNNNSKRAKKN